MEAALAKWLLAPTEPRTQRLRPPGVGLTRSSGRWSLAARPSRSASRRCASARSASSATSIQAVTLEARHSLLDDEMTVSLRYRDGDRRYVQLEGVSGDARTGTRIGATAAFRF